MVYANLRMNVAHLDSQCSADITLLTYWQPTRAKHPPRLASAAAPPSTAVHGYVRVDMARLGVVVEGVGRCRRVSRDGLARVRRRRYAHA